MLKDISKVLDGWDFQPDEVQVRVITGEDGREKIQLRVDLGLLQMEMSGRPDGTRPEGNESWFEFYVEKQRIHEATNPDSIPFQLNDEDCLRLWREAVQYYHRYLSLWHLEMYEPCARDTQRNLRLFAFIKSYAQGDRNKLQFDQWRPYVLMMHARAVGTPLVEKRDFPLALRVIESGIDAIREFLDEYNQNDRTEQCAELVNLERWRDEVVAKAEEAGSDTPAGKLVLLRRQLQQAVVEERFEEAAQLRDEIHRLSGEA